MDLPDMEIWQLIITTHLHQGKEAFLPLFPHTLPLNINQSKNEIKKKLSQKDGMSNMHDAKISLTWKLRGAFYKKIPYLTREFHIKFHMKTNNARIDSGAMSAKSDFQVKFYVEFISQVTDEFSLNT